MDREKLRGFADVLPFMGLVAGLVKYVVVDKLFGLDNDGLTGLGATFGAALIIAWVLRKISGATWRQTLWPRREPADWEEAPPSIGLVKELARKGQRIQAIKVYRELTGADLKTSNDAVKAMHP